MKTKDQNPIALLEEMLNEKFDKDMKQQFEKQKGVEISDIEIIPVPDDISVDPS